MKTLTKTLPLLLVLFVLSGCKNKKKTYTTANVTEEIKGKTETIKQLRLKGNLDEAAKKTQELATNILSTYPKATMYREHIIRFLRYAMKISRLCRDKSLELKNESINPEDAQKYTSHADKIDNQLMAIRKNLNSIKWMVPPKPKEKEEDKTDKEEKKDNKEITDKTGEETKTENKEENKTEDKEENKTEDKKAK